MMALLRTAPKRSFAEYLQEVKPMADKIIEGLEQD